MLATRNNNNNNNSNNNNNNNNNDSAVCILNNATLFSRFAKHSAVRGCRILLSRDLFDTKA